MNAQGDILLTRDGRFTTSPDGRLVNARGEEVLDELRAPIQVNMQSGEPVIINLDGSVFQGGGQIARLGIVDVADRSALEKQGDNQFRLTRGDFELLDPTDTHLRQGYLENSNVQAILEVTRMMETSRAYEGATRLIRTVEELKRKSIEKLAAV